ncbi:MAG: PD40 domain-containing protein [Anaerolineae bacterium]|nr:PD40 domain-containing protein [Anaerolineae bacterium]
MKTWFADMLKNRPSSSRADPEWVYAGRNCLHLKTNGINAMKHLRSGVIGLLMLILGIAARLPIQAAAGEDCVEFYAPYVERLRTVFDISSGSLRSYLAPPPSETTHAYHSPDGRFAVTLDASTEGGFPLILTEFPTGRTQTLAGRALVDLAWSADSTRLATLESSGGAEGAYVLVVRDADSGRTASSAIPALFAGLPNFAWSPDGSRIAIAGRVNGETQALLFDAGTLDVIDQRRVGVANPHITWSPSSRFIVFGGEGVEAALLDLQTPALTPLVSPFNSNRASAAFSPDDSYVIIYSPSSDFSFSFNLFRSDGTPVLETSAGFFYEGMGPSYAWLDEDRLILSAPTVMLTDDLSVIDLKTGETRIIHQGVENWALSPDGRQVAVVPDQNTGQGNALFLYDLTAPEGAAPTEVALPLDPFSLIWSGDGSTLVTASYTGALWTFAPAARNWRERGVVQTGGILRRVPCRLPALEAETCTTSGGFSVRSVIRLADGTRLPVHSGREYASNYHPDPRYSLVRLAENQATGEFTLAVHDAITGFDSVVENRVSSLILPSLSVSPDRSLIAVTYGFPQTRLEVLDALNFRSLATIRVAEEETKMAWSPSGRYIALGTPADVLDSFTLYEVFGEATLVKSHWRNWRLVDWSPDERYVIEHGTYTDFSVKMSVFTPTGEPVIEDMIITSTDIEGKGLYAWLDNHTLVAAFDDIGIVPSAVDLRAPSLPPRRLDGAEFDYLPCKEGEE